MSQRATPKMTSATLAESRCNGQDKDWIGTAEASALLGASRRSAQRLAAPRYTWACTPVASSHGWRRRLRAVQGDRRASLSGAAASWVYWREAGQPCVDFRFESSASSRSANSRNSAKLLVRKLLIRHHLRRRRGPSAANRPSVLRARSWTRISRCGRSLWWVIEPRGQLCLVLLVLLCRVIVAREENSVAHSPGAFGQRRALVLDPLVVSVHSHLRRGW